MYFEAAAELHQSEIYGGIIENIHYINLLLYFFFLLIRRRTVILHSLVIEF